MTFVCCVAVSVRRRSSASFGRIEIRFSCCDSQPTVFMNRSRLPWMPSAPLAAKSESPITTTRVSGFGASVARLRRRRRRRRGATPPRRSRPVPSCRPSPRRATPCPVVISALMSVSAQLRGLVSMNGCAVWPFTPPCTGDDRSRQRIRGHVVEALGDRMRRIVGGDRHRRVGADQPAHAADVDDDVVADVDAPVVRERDQVGERRAVGLVRRIELEQQLARLVEILLQRVDFGREEVGSAARDDDDRRIVGHGAGCASTSLSTV